MDRPLGLADDYRDLESTKYKGHGGLRRCEAHGRSTGSSVSITTSRTTIVNNEDGTVSTTKSEHTAEIVSDVSSHEANKKTQAEEDPEAGAAVIHRPESEGGSAAVRRFVDLATFANTHTRPRDGDDVCDCFRCAQLWRP